MKGRIVEIHDDDAYSVNRATLIGKIVTMNLPCPYHRDGRYVGGVAESDDGQYYYFLCVKLGDIEKPLW